MLISTGKQIHKTRLCTAVYGQKYLEFGKDIIKISTYDITD
jgi:hypothetical protein